MSINEPESKVDVSLKLAGQLSADRVFDTRNRPVRESTLSEMAKPHLLAMRHMFSWMQHKLKSDIDLFSHPWS
jgi:hypothetical protein